MLVRALALSLLAGCSTPATDLGDDAAPPVAAGQAVVAGSEGVPADTVDADLSAVPADLRRCVAASVREGGLRFEVVGEVEQGGTRYVLVEGYEPDDALGVFSFVPRLLRVEGERCENVLVIGSDAYAIADHVGDQYGDLIRQAAASEVKRVGGASTFEAAYRGAGWADLRECGEGALASDTGCFEPAWAEGYRAAGVTIGLSATSPLAENDLRSCIPTWARADGAIAEVTARADTPNGMLILVESIYSGWSPVEAAVSFRPVLLRLRGDACESLLPERTDNVDLRAYASAAAVQELLRENAAWNAGRAGGTGAYAELLAEGYGGTLVECAERGGEAGFCVDPDRAAALRAIGIHVVLPD